MDMNSYSYAPHMLDEPENVLAAYATDDADAELRECESGRLYIVSAYDYDGDFDVYKEFKNLPDAMKLYEAMVNTMNKKMTAKEKK